MNITLPVVVNDKAYRVHFNSYGVALQIEALRRNRWVNMWKRELTHRTGLGPVTAAVLEAAHAAKKAQLPLA
jgi:hypothetical protein